MIVNYDKESGWTNIFSKNTGHVQMSVEAVSALEKLKFVNMDTISSMDDLGKATGYTNKSFYEFAKTADTSGDLVVQYQTHLDKTVKSTSKLSGITSTLKSFGSSILSMGANMIAGFAIGAVISTAISAIDDYIHRNERLIEAGEEAKSSIESTFSEFSDSKSSIDSLGKSLSDNAENIKTTGDAIDSIAEKYTKLREGVSQFDNSNQSLSTEEYQSYIDISNQIADQFPTLIAGYDAQGNAILNLGSNADSAAASLTNLYNASMQSSNVEIGEDLQDVYKGVTAQIDEYQKQVDVWQDNIDFTNKLSDKISEDLSGDTLNIDLTDYAMYYKDALKEVRGILDDQGIVADEYGNAFSFNLAGVSDKTREEIKTSLNDLFTVGNAQAQQSISGTELLIEEQWDSLATSVGQYLQTSPAFTNLNGDLQNAMLQNITDLDLSKIKSDYGGDISQYIYTELLSPLQNMSPEVQSAVADLFNIDVNSLSFDEYQNVISDALAKAFPNDTETQNQMKELFGFDQVTEDAEKQLNRLRDQFGSAVDDLSLSELETGFDLVVNDGFSGTFDELKDKIEDAKALAATSVDLDVRTNMDAIEAALESENAGADYEKAVGYLEQAKELFDQGLVGTDDFKSIAAYLSPTGSDDPVNFAENYGKALRYLTDDGQGVQNFLEDLQSKGLATMETLSDGTQQWSYDIDDLQDAATDMGIGFEFMMDMFGRLEDYGFHNNFVGSVEDGAQKITDLSTQLAQEEAKLAQLQAEGANTTAIEQQQEKVNALKNDIQETRAAMEQLVQASADDYAEQVRNAKESISTLAAEREKILKENTYGSDTQQVADLMEQEIRNLAQQNGIELDANLNIIEPEELPTITINAKINKEQLNSQLNNLQEGQTLAFQGDVDGKTVNIEGTKTQYGNIIYTADIEGVERTLTLVESEDGTISFTAETSNVEEEVGLLKKDLDAQLSDLSVGQKIKLSAEVDGVDSEIEAVKNEYGTITYFAEVDGVKQEVGLIQNEDGTISFTSEFNTGDFESKLSNLTQGQTVVLTVEINGEEKIVEATKDKDGKIVYTADVDGVLTKVEPVANTDGTITFIPITDEVDEETSKTDGGERETEFTPNDKALNAVEKVTDGGSRFVDYIANTTNLPNHFSPVTRTVNYVANGVSAAINALRSAAGFASGTMLTPAKASGTAYNVLNLKPAYVGGSVALSKDEKALVNEMGTESIIRSGQWSLLPGGMHIESLKKGDIVLNASQTKALLQYGKAPGHARAYASGSLLASYANGSGGGSFFVGGSGSSSGASGRPSSSSSKGSSSKKSSSSSKSSSKSSEKASKSAEEAADKFEEIVDSIEILLDRMDRSIQKLTDSIETYSYDLSKQSAASDKAMNTIRSNLTTLQSAYNRYIKEANDVRLSDTWKKRVQNGAIDITTITDENLADQIKKYQEYYEKALDVQDTIADYQSQLLDLATQKLDNIEQYFENWTNYNDEFGYLTDISTLQDAVNKLTAELDKQVLAGVIKEGSNEFYSAMSQIAEAQDALIEATLKKYQDIIDNLDRISTTLDNSLELKEARGETITEEDYQRPLEVANEQIDELYKKREQLLKQQGIYDVGSAKYDDYAEQIGDIDDEIYGLLGDIEDLKDKIWEVRWEPFFDGMEAAENLRDEMDQIRDLLDSDAFVDTKGGLTAEGITNLSLISSAMNVEKQRIRDYQEAISKLNEDLDAGNISTSEYEEQLDSFLSEIRSGVSAVNDYEDEILSLHEEMLQAENDIIQNSIEKYQKLNKERQESDTYARNIRNQTKEINQIEAQLSALSGVTNESALRQKKLLEAQLAELQDELDQTQQDHAYDVRDQGYQNLSDSLNEQLNDTLDNIKYNSSEQERVISEMLNHIVNNYADAYDKINQIISDTGLVPSDGFQQVIDNIGTQQGTQNQVNDSNTIAPDYTPNDYVTDINTGAIQSGSNQANNDKIQSEIEKEPNTTNRPVAQITLKPTSLSLQEGKSSTIKATIRPTDAANKSVKWSSSNTKVATVSNGVVKAVKAGSAKITCTAQDGSGISASCSVTVTAKPKPTRPSASTSGGDGKPRVGDKATLTGWYYYDSYGKSPAGNRYSGVKNGVVIDAYSASKYGGNGRNTGGFDVHIKSADGKYGDLGWVKLSQLKGYATGTKGITNSIEIARVDELGKELRIKRGGDIYEMFRYGDSVIPKHMTDNLFTLADHTNEIMETINSVDRNGGGDVTVNNNYDSLLTVNGDITKETFPGVKKMCEEAYRYTAKEFKKDARYMGITRTL